MIILNPCLSFYLSHPLAMAIHHVNNRLVSYSKVLKLFPKTSFQSNKQPTHLTFPTFPFPQMLRLAVTVKTTGATAPAASLYPFYEKKEVVKTFIIVTDEEENNSFENYRYVHQSSFLSRNCSDFQKYRIS